MDCILIELAPYIILECIYRQNKNGVITVLSGSINGVNIKMTKDQKDYIEEEILFLLEEDIEEDDIEEYIFCNN
jgi:hypothetical protein